MASNEENTPLSQLSEGIALVDPLKLRKQEHSEEISRRLLTLFGWSVGCTWLLALALSAVDYTFIGLKLIEPADRLITEKILLSILGATIVQLGAVVSGIVYAVFKSPISETSSETPSD